MTDTAGLTDQARRRQQRGWSYYDWANSAFSATVTTVMFGPYITSVARTAACGAPVTEEAPCAVADPQLDVLGLSIAPEAFSPLLLAVAIGGQVLLLPLMGALADASSHKKRLLAATAFTGAAATMAMYFLVGDRYLLGGALYLIAQAAFGASMVVYNAYLPEIAEADERDKVSARGWALGYLGGGLLLAANLALLSFADQLGLTQGEAVRISLLSAGVWWAAFTLIPLFALRDRPPPIAPPAGVGALRRSVTQLRGTFARVRRTPGTLRFLIAYLIYNDAIQTVIALSSNYGTEELKLPLDSILIAILVVQFVAFFGAVLLGRFARSLGAKKVILGSLVVWAGLLFAGLFIQTGSLPQFLALAAGIGLVLGGSQALSRSLFSQMIPTGREAEYFSLYEISERGTSWLGAILVAVIVDATGSYRYAIASLVVFFVAGFVLLSGLDVRRAIAEAGNEQPERI